MSEAVKHLKAMFHTLLSWGKVTATSDSTGYQNLEISSHEGEDFTEVLKMGHFGFASNPPADSVLIVACIGGERGHMVSLAEEWAGRFKNLKAGESALYDAFGKSIHLHENGITINAAGKPVAIVNAPTITTDGDLTVAGSINAGVDINAGRNINDQYGPMNDIREVYNQHTHDDSSTPTPTM